jgi:hypothetical protein
VLSLWQLRDVVARILKRDKLATAGREIGSSNARFQPRSAVTLQPDSS